MMEENKYQVMALDPDKSLQLFDVASKLLESGLYKQVPNAAAAFAVVQFGAELGYGPMVSLQNISMIQGKPCCSAQMMLAQMKRAGWNYRIIESTDTVCRLLFSCGDHQETIEYTIDEANRAGLTGKDTWKKYPKDLLFSRCVSRANRRLAPETSMGMYTIEELEVDQPAIGPDKAKNVTPAIEPESDKPDWFKNLSPNAKKEWEFLSKSVVPQFKHVNEKMLNLSLPQFNHEVHLCNSVAQYLQETKDPHQDANYWWHRFKDWHQAKHEAKAAAASADPTTGELLPDDELPWSDDNMQKELIACFDDDTIKLFRTAFKKAGIAIKTDKELLELVRDAANKARIGLDLFQSDMVEYGNKLIDYKKKIDLEEINKQIPPG